MCLILLAIDAHADYPLVLVANRDEFYRRPAAPAAFWENDPALLAGQDLQAGGTWLGLCSHGALAAVTNLPPTGTGVTDAPLSRGSLVSDYLASHRHDPAAHLAAIRNARASYGGFNLLLGGSGHFLLYSNHDDAPIRLGAGVHAIGNAPPGEQTTKLAKGRAALARLLGDTAPSADALTDMMRDARPADDGQDSRSRAFSARFVRTPEYGTRCTTVLLRHRGGEFLFRETTWQPGSGEALVQRDFRITPD